MKVHIKRTKIPKKSENIAHSLLDTYLFNIKFRSKLLVTVNNTGKEG